MIKMPPERRTDEDGGGPLNLPGQRKVIRPSSNGMVVKPLCPKVLDLWLSPGSSNMLVMCS